MEKHELLVYVNFRHACCAQAIAAEREGSCVGDEGECGQGGQQLCVSIEGRLPGAFVLDLTWEVLPKMADVIRDTLAAVQEVPRCTYPWAPVKPFSLAPTLLRAMVLEAAFPDDSSSAVPGWLWELPLPGSSFEIPKAEIIWRWAQPNFLKPKTCRRESRRA